MVYVRSRLCVLVWVASMGSWSAQGKNTQAFECTDRQAAEDLAAIEAEDYRYHQAGAQ